MHKLCRCVVIVSAFKLGSITGLPNVAAASTPEGYISTTTNSLSGGTQNGLSEGSLTPSTWIGDTGSSFGPPPLFHCHVC